MANDEWRREPSEVAAVHPVVPPAGLGIVSRETILSGRANASTQSESMINPTSKGNHGKPMPKAVLYKTVACRQWTTGKCSFGERCHFAHGEREQRTRNNSLKPESILKTTKVKQDQPMVHEKPNNVITKDCQVTFLEHGQIFIHDKDESVEPTQDQVYPTTAAIRAKLMRDDKEKEWQEAGDKDAIKASRKRKPQDQEEHFDDCGSDCEPLRDAEEVTALATSHFLDDQVTASFYDDEHGTDESISAMHDIVDSKYLQQNLLGSDAEADQGLWKTKPEGSVFVSLQNLDSFLSHHTRLGDMDVMEICGGAGGVSKIGIRRRLKTGHNFDLVTGGDLTKKENVLKLMEYVRIHKPMVVVMAPPCTAMGGWAHLNKVLHPET